MRKVKILQMYRNCISMFLGFFEKEKDWEDIYTDDDDTQHHYCWYTCHRWEKSSDGWSNQECCSECSSHKSHVLCFFFWAWDVWYIGLNDSKTCPSKSTDESGEKKKYKQWSESFKKIDDMVEGKRTHLDRRMADHSITDMDCPNTDEHDNVAQEIDDTRIGEYFPSSESIRELSEKKSSNKHSESIECLGISSPGWIDWETFDNTREHGDKQWYPQNIEKCCYENERELRFLYHENLWIKVYWEMFVFQYLFFLWSLRRP